MLAWKTNNNVQGLIAMGGGGGVGGLEGISPPLLFVIK